MKTQEKIKPYTELSPGERWASPTTKITVKIPTSAVEGFLKKFVENKGATVAWWAGFFLMHGIAGHIFQYETRERAHRKAAGYAKRSYRRRYGMDPTEEEVEDYLKEINED